MLTKCWCTISNLGHSEVLLMTVLTKCGLLDKMLIFRWVHQREHVDLLIICGGIFGGNVDKLWRWVNSGCDIDILWDRHGQYVDFWPTICPHFLCQPLRNQHRGIKIPRHYSHAQHWDHVCPFLPKSVAFESERVSELTWLREKVVPRLRELASPSGQRESGGGIHAT